MRKVIRLAYQSAESKLDPQAESDEASGSINESIFDALLQYDYLARPAKLRVQYDTAPGGYWAGGRPSWVHGYPLAEENLMRIMNEISLVDAHLDDINVATLDRFEAGDTVTPQSLRDRPDRAPRTC